MRPWLIPLAMVACSGKGPEEVEFTTDVRVDMADAAHDPDSKGTQMCVTNDGVVYVLWMDDREDVGSDKYDIWLNRSLNRGGEDPDNNGAPTEKDWLQAPVKVNQGDGNVWAPSLFCNEVGVFVVWEDDRDGILSNHQIYFNRSIDQGETFDAEDHLLELDPEGMSMSLGPKITGVGQDLFVAWYDNLNNAYDILMSSSGDAGETWREPVRVDSDQPAGSAYSARPEIAVSENTQNIWITWEDSRDGAADVYFARSDNGGTTFKEDQRLDGGDDKGATDSFEPEICTDQNSNLTVVWHDARDGQYRDVFMNYSADAGASWFPSAVRLDTDSAGFNNSLFPSCIQVANTAHVVWEDNRNGNYDLYYRPVSDGIPGNEVRADRGTGPGFSNSLDHQLAVNDTQVVVAWEDGRNAPTDVDGYDDLYYNFASLGADDWLDFNDDQDDLRIDSMYDGQSFKVDLQIAVLGGEIYSAWTDGRNGTSDIFFQRLAIGDEAVPPPLDAVQTTP